LAENPSITVQVNADIKALSDGMNKAEQTVKTATGNMAKAVDANDIGKKMEVQAGKVGTAMQAMSQHASKVGASFRALADTIGKVGQAASGLDVTRAIGGGLMQTGIPQLAAVGGLTMLAGELYEKMTGAGAKAAKEQMEKLFAMTEEDLKRQLAILRETDPLKKAELEYERDLAKIRKEMADLEKKGADDAAKKVLAVQEELLLEQKKQKIAELTKKDAVEAAKISQAGAVGSITTSLGGTFNFAQNAILNGIQSIAIKQHAVQQNILAAAKDILNVLRNGGVAIT
jgi:hypothetical protein